MTMQMLASACKEEVSWTIEQATVSESRGIVQGYGGIEGS